MNYTIRRNDQSFGPYTLDQLRAYVQSGNISADDLATSDASDQPVAVRQILGDIAPEPVVIEPLPLHTRVALPPNLHWGWLLLLNVLTRSWFNCIWVFVLAAWARRLSGRNDALVYAAMYPVGVISGAVALGIGNLHHMMLVMVIGCVILIGGIVSTIAANFSIRSAMHDYYNSVEDIGLELGPFMTFFFGPIYIQYHVNDLARMRRAESIV